MSVAIVNLINDKSAFHTDCLERKDGARLDFKQNLYNDQQRELAES